MGSGSDMPAGAPALEARLSELLDEGGFTAQQRGDPFLHAFLIKEHGLAPEGAVAEYGEKHARLVCGDEVLWSCGRPVLRFKRCVERDGALHMLCNISCPLFVFEDAPELLAVVDGEKRRIGLSPSGYGYRRFRMRVANTWRFELSVALPRRGTACEVDFRLRFGQRRVARIATLLKLMRCNARKPKGGRDLVFPSCAVRVRKDGLTLSARETGGRVGEYLRDLRRDKANAGLRRDIRRYADGGRRRVWLYSDLPTSPMRNNALEQVLHDLQADDGVTRLYVTKCADELLGAYPALAGHLVETGSREHLLAFMAADTVLASYLDRSSFMPCKKTVYNKLGDLSVPKRFVYLQHGVLHAHMPWYFSYDRTCFDAVVVSTGFEAGNLVANYGYPREAILATGAPRLDRLRYGQAGGRRILYAPSWRPNLVGGSARERVAAADAFRGSSFLAGVAEFLRLVSESGVLERHGYTLELKLHPNFRMYADALDLSREGVRLAPETVDEGAYAVMVTDYSSYLYDFLYAGARIMYFLPDEGDFLAGAGHYDRLDLPFEEGFGPYCNDPGQAARELGRIVGQVERGEPEPEVYARRREGFFLHTDGGNARRLYEALRRAPGEAG